jgi:predicted RNase H-like HicB family nuclease
MASVTEYVVEVSREGTAWLADVPQLPGVHTWGKNLSGLEDSIREAIALAEDLPDGAESDLGLHFEYHTGDERLDHLTEELRRTRASLEAEEAALTTRTSEAAAELVHVAHLPVRDVAVLLAVSPQRISQVAPQRLSGKGRSAANRHRRPGQ